jgi:hypothetical protein
MLRILRPRVRIAVELLIFNDKRPWKLIVSEKDLFAGMLLPIVPRDKV